MSFRVLAGILKGDASVMVNKKLMHSIGINEAIMYCELLSKYSYFLERGQIGEDGFFFNTVENFWKDTALSKHQQLQAVKRLKEVGLIDHKVKGMPAKRYFRIKEDEELLIKLLDSSCLKIGQQDGEKVDNHSSKIGQQDGEKVDGNNTNNNTNCNNTNNNLLNTIQEEWNQQGVNPIKKLNPNTNRFKSLNARINEYGLDLVLEAVRNVGKSKFLKGQNNRSWTITFDWLIKPNNFAKVLEGNYTDKENGNGPYNSEYKEDYSRFDRFD